MSELDRVLLTYIRGERYISQSRLVTAYEAISDKLNGEGEIKSPIDEVEKHISAINSKIADHGFKIERRNNEITGELTYVFINTSADETIKVATNYSAPELDAIKTIIDDIIDAVDYAFSIGRVTCHQVVAAKLNKTLSESASFVDRLIDDGWFICTTNDRIALSIKTVVELKSYLITRHGSSKDSPSPGKILLCEQCNQILTAGYMDKRETPIYLHYKCFDVYRRTKETGETLIEVGIDPETV
ncbi:Nse1 non-SMC component of SMC5-6 complex-domain-containing protein [Scheffersomyces amazonensis]|uniref:Nse1 non-SMC component of SMC5-6 complex-domain-containing protein n=1 Tax=Scheffersomyces amazonensis TaxID=1078765 RepID=UPI00315C9DDE